MWLIISYGRDSKELGYDVYSGIGKAVIEFKKRILKLLQSIILLRYDFCLDEWVIYSQRNN